jgi:hypothetical protein
MIDQLSISALLMTRHNPQIHKSVLLIAHTSFYQPNKKWKYIIPFLIEGIIDFRSNSFFAFFHTLTKKVYQIKLM